MDEVNILKVRQWALLAGFVLSQVVSISWNKTQSSEIRELRDSVGTANMIAGTYSDDQQVLIKIIKDQEQRIAELSARCEANKCKCNTQVSVDLPVKEEVGTIYMHTMPGCPPCSRWKREELSKAEKAGWDVEIIQYGARDNTYPQFEVKKNGKRFWIKPGFYTFKQLSKAEAP